MCATLLPRVCSSSWSLSATGSSSSCSSTTFTLTLEDSSDRAGIEAKVLAKYKVTGGELVTRFVGIEVARTRAHTTLTQTACPHEATTLEQSKW